MAISWVTLIAGLGVFLAGVRILAVSLQQLAGPRLARSLRAVAGSPGRAFVMGAVVAAALHSSGVTGASSIALVHAGLLTEAQGFALILGANIGTTITAQLVTFSTQAWVEPLLTAGLVLILVAVLGRLGWMPVVRQRLPVAGGAAVFGLGSLFFGIELMAAAAHQWAGDPHVIAWLVSHSGSVWSAALLGAIVAALLQSSTVTVGLAIVAHAHGLFSLPTAVAIVLGANVGTSVQGLLASLGTDVAARKTAVADLLFNAVGVLLFIPFLPAFTRALEQLSAIPARRVADAHTLFNVGTAVAAFPWIPQILRLADWLVAALDGPGWAQWSKWLRWTRMGTKP